MGLDVHAFGVQVCPTLPAGTRACTTRDKLRYSQAPAAVHAITMGAHAQLQSSLEGE